MEKDILKHSGDNLGGNFGFRFLFVESIQAIPETIGGTIHAEVTLQAGTRWMDCRCTEESMNYKEDPQESDHGSYFYKEFSAFIPKERPETVDFLNANKNRRFILDITDNNGSRRLVGTREEPMYFRSSHDTKDKVSGINGNRIVFYGDGEFKSPFYDVASPSA
jgi:hypothetical protein